MRRQCGLLLVIAAAGVAGVARAQDSSRFYVGVRLGYSQLNADLASAFGLPEEITSSIPETANDALNDRSESWGLFVGFRPKRVMGAELAYTDFGHTSGSYGSNTRSGSVETGATAFVLSGVFYVPLRSTLFDVYGKVGAARLESTLNGRIFTRSAGVCVNGCMFDGRIEKTHVSPAYGAGVRLNVSDSVTVALEYERIDGSDVDPTLRSIGFAWRF